MRAVHAGGAAPFALGYFLYRFRRDIFAAFKDAGVRWYALAFSGIALGWSPWLPFFLRQRDRVAEQWYARPFSIDSVPRMCYEMFFFPELHRLGPVREYTVAMLCVLAVLVMLWRAGAGRWCAACLAVVPFALIALASAAGFNLMVARYMTFVQPFALVAIAAGWGGFRSPG